LHPSATRGDHHISAQGTNKPVKAPRISPSQCEALQGEDRHQNYSVHKDDYQHVFGMIHIFHVICFVVNGTAPESLIHNLGRYM
jgi:hypothetical protein